MDDKQIQALVKDEYGIQNHLYLERIACIAHGNPRLAIMAAQLAKKENTLQSINDVSSLYDEYYSSIRQELTDLDDPNLLKTAGIVAFFRTVDRSNNEMVASIEQAFGIPSNAFWNAAQKLHDFEMLDMYENEIVRISDQVLSTYLFYLAFFKEQKLNFSAILDNFFPQFHNRLIDAVIPVINVFYCEALLKKIRPHIDRIWKKLEKAGDEHSLLQLIDAFWFLKETDALLYLRKHIKRMEEEPLGLSNLKFEPESNIQSPSLLSLLGHFSNSERDSLRIALSLLFDYLAKRSSEFPKVLHLLTENFGFKHNSYPLGFGVQQDVIEVLQERTKGGEDKLFSKLFLAVGKHYLHTRFHNEIRIHAAR